MSHKKSIDVTQNNTYLTDIDCCEAVRFYRQWLGGDLYLKLLVNQRFREAKFDAFTNKSELRRIENYDKNK